MSWDYNGYLHLGVGFSLEQKPKFSFSNLRLKKLIFENLDTFAPHLIRYRNPINPKTLFRIRKIIFCSNKFQFCNYQKYFFCGFSLLMTHWPHKLMVYAQGSADKNMVFLVSWTDVCRRRSTFHAIIWRNRNQRTSKILNQSGLWKKSYHVELALVRSEVSARLGAMILVSYCKLQIICGVLR